MPRCVIGGRNCKARMCKIPQDVVIAPAKKGSNHICVTHLKKISTAKKKREESIKKIKVIVKENKEVLLYNEDQELEDEALNKRRYWYDFLPEIVANEKNIDFKDGKLSNTQVIELFPYFLEKLEIGTTNIHIGSDPLKTLLNQMNISRRKGKKSVFVEFVLDKGHFSVMIEKDSMTTWFNTASRTHGSVFNYVQKKEKHSINYCRQIDGDSCGFFSVHFALQLIYLNTHDVDDEFIYGGFKELCKRALSNCK